MKINSRSNAAKVIYTPKNNYSSNDTSYRSSLKGLSCQGDSRQKKDASASIKKDLPEADSIYGGNASAVFQYPPPPKEETKTTSWSPSLQNLLDRPPSTLPQRLIAGATLFFLAAGSWAWFGTIEETARARGKLIAGGETYKIESIDRSKVTKVLVKEGEAVNAGQALLELDTELAQKEVERLKEILLTYQRELNQEQALLERVDLEAKTLATMARAETQSQNSTLAAAKARAATQRQLIAQMQSQLGAHQKRQTQLKPFSAILQQRLGEMNSEIAAHQKRIQKLKYLQKQGAISQEYVFQAEQALRQSQQRLSQSQLQEVNDFNERLFQSQQALSDMQMRAISSLGELAQTNQEIEGLKAKSLEKQAMHRKVELEEQQKIQQLQVEITQMKGTISETSNLLESAKTKLQQKVLKAPVDGIVSLLELQNPGKVIEAGQTIAEIAPRGASLILSTFLPSREAGFVKEGMPVQIKFDAYPYQNYGIISGKVLSISADAISHEQLGSVYRVQVSLDRDYITESGEKIEFKPGQTAIAEIVMRRRRLADMLLDPIRQLGEDGINL